MLGAGGLYLFLMDARRASESFASDAQGASAASEIAQRDVPPLPRNNKTEQLFPQASREHEEPEAHSDVCIDDIQAPECIEAITPLIAEIDVVGNWVG